jgi:hypothetical protein
MNVSKYLVGVTLSLAFVQGSAVFGQLTTPIYNWSYQNHASTAAEGFLNGQARVIEAASQANYLNSIAAVNYQEANSKWIDNQKKYLTNYYEHKVYSKEIRDRYAKQPPTREQVTRIAMSALPEPLTAQAYDRASGQLVWPHILRSSEYDAFRKRIDELMGKRSTIVDGNGSAFEREVSSLVEAMRMLLKTNLQSVTDNQYAESQAFLRSLAFEVTKSSNQAAAATTVVSTPKAQPPVDASASSK